MAQQVDKSLTTLINAKVDDTQIIMLIFKSLEIGTLTTQSTMNSLEQHGISFHINRQYFHQELPNDLIFEASLHTNDIPSATYNNDPNTHINNNNDQDIPNNKNDQDNINFSEYIAQPTKAWTQAYNLFRSNADANASLKYENLLTTYKNLMNLTSTSTSVKQLPKGISTFKRAFEHLKAIFIPRLV